MANKLIELEDGTLVEVDVPGEHVEQISGGYTDKVEEKNICTGKKYGKSIRSNGCCWKP